MAATIASASGRTSAGVPSAFSARTTLRVQALGLGNALLLVDAGQNDAIGQAQAGDQIGCKHLAAQRVGARLEHRPKARTRINGAQAPQGFANGGRMVGKVFDDGDAADLGAHFQAPLDAFEGRERLDDGLFGDALASARAAAAVAFSALCSPARCISSSAHSAPSRQTSQRVRPFSWRRLRMLPVSTFAEAVPLYAAEGAADALGYVFAAVVGHDEAAARDKIHEALESAS